MGKRRPNSAITLVIVASMVAFLLPGAAMATQEGDRFTCRASAVRTEGFPIEQMNREPVAANRPNDPCVTAQDERGVGPIAVGPVIVTDPFAETGGDSNSAFARSGVAALAGPGFRATIIESRADVTCVDGQPRLSGSSSIATLTTDQGTTGVITNHREVQIPGVGTLHLNEQTSSSNSLTQRAVFLDTAAGDVIIGEATADYRGNPCAGDDGDGPPECSDDVDNTDPEDTVADEDDPGCHTDGNPKNPTTYDPNDDDETDEGTDEGGLGAPECSDEIDNDGDGLVDFSPEPGQGDPDCLSPQDDSESSDGPEEPECSDGQDNDGDGDSDYPYDPGCENRQDDSESDGDGPECGDGADNDADGASDAADSGCKGNPLNDDEADGWITGGGGYDEFDEKRDRSDSVSPGTRLRSAAGPLTCDLEDKAPGPNLNVTWHEGGTDAKGLVASWKLTKLTRAFCRDDPFIDPEQPESEFDTYVGGGLGTFTRNNKTTKNVRAEWVRIDRGEPGSPEVIGIDYFEIYIFNENDQVLAYGTGTFDMGNKQAH